MPTTPSLLPSLLRVLAVCGVSGATLLAGCTGSITKPTGDSGQSSPGTGRNPASPPGTSTMMGGGAGVAPPPGPMGGPNNAFIDRDSPALARLTNAEYSQTVTDVLGEPSDAATRHRFPADPRQHGFDNNGTLLQITPTHSDRYATAAAAIAAATFTDPARRALVPACASATDQACLTTFIQRIGRRLYRRTLDAAEVTSFVALAKAGADAGAAVPGTMGAADNTNIGPQTVLEAMLQSPHFLYRVQIGVADAGRPGITGLNGFEMATRLSYVLLGTTPDDALLDQAQSGALNTQAGVQKVVQGMLADPRLRSGMKRFYEQWLPLTKIASAEAERSPRGDKQLGTDLVEETRRFVDDVIWSPSATLPDLMTAKYTFVNANLAKLYGLPAPATTDAWQRVEFPTGTARAGLLTQGSILAAGSHGEKPSSTLRGQMVREQLLCEDVPSPPPDVNNDELVAKPGETEQATFARHTTQPSCAACHTLMDPIGWGLSGFDGAGAARTKDSNGQPLSIKGRVEGMTPPEFEGPVELGQKIAASAQFKACFARQLFRYVYGRAETNADETGITQLRSAFETAGWRLTGGLTALVASDGFRYRSKGDAP